MAPPPEYDKEPKAPDKSATSIPGDDSKALHNIVNDHQNNSESKTANATANVEIENNKHVEHLDDGQLKALLDEAITYKCPKDREGKSSLFNELLEEVEQDEQALEAAAREVSGGRAARRAARGGRRALAHSNSLQDLEQEALAAECALRRVRHASHAPSNVSARATHGGSLPSDVDKSFLLGEESSGRGGYLATVRCVNPPPLNERRVSASDAHEHEPTPRRSKPAYPMTYTARATLEIGSGSVGSGRAVTTTTASNQIDSAIPFNCITSPEVVDACSTTSSAQASVVEETKPRSVISSSFNGLPLARSSYGSTGTTTSSDEYKKSIDENGNSLQGFSSPQSGSSHNKKPRRKKSSRNETVITSHQIDGYKGDKDLNEVLRFIESDAEPRHKLGRAKHRDDAAADDKAGKKRPADRRKDKETKMKRATSMEELSRTKLEDLTDTQRPRREPAPAKPERRSWGDDARDAFYFRDDAADAPPDADFQTVTKKRKPRRRADEPEPEPPRCTRPRPPTPRARRVSAPPSDRSADSNDDMDSVHSLPADAPRHAAPAPAPVSYADIARTRHNIPDLIESCNFYAEGGGREAREAGEARAARGDADGYPALEPRLHARRPRDHQPKPPAPQARSRDRKEVRSVTCVPEPAAACPAPDVVADRRPPVILLDSAARPGDMDGVTFGFDINEQLLGGSTRRPRCDLVRDAVESDAAKDDVAAPPAAESAKPAPAGSLPGAVKPAAAVAPATVVVDTVKPVVETPVAVKPVGCGVAAAAAGGAAVAGACGALRWVPPPPRPPHDTHHLLQLVDYVAQAWEDVVRCGSGKVRYFAE